MKRAFWFHYNKPASAQQGRPVLTVHYMGKCHMVNLIDCQAGIETRIRKTQPRCVMAGKGEIQFEEHDSLRKAIIK